MVRRPRGRACRGENFSRGAESGNGEGWRPAADGGAADLRELAGKHQAELRLSSLSVDMARYR